MKWMNSGTGIPDGYRVSFAPTSVGGMPPEAAKVSRRVPRGGRGGQDCRNGQEGKSKTGSHTDLPVAPNSVICPIPCCQRRHPGPRSLLAGHPPGASLGSTGTKAAPPLCTPPSASLRRPSGRPGSVRELICGSATEPDAQQSLWSAAERRDKCEGRLGTRLRQEAGRAACNEPGHQVHGPNTGPGPSP